MNNSQEMDYSPEYKKLLELSKEELEKIFSQLSIDEIKKLFEKLEGVENND